MLCVKGVKNRRDFHVSSWVGLELTPNYLLLSLITTTLVLYSKEIKEGKDSFFSYQCQRRIFKYWSCGLVNNNFPTAVLYAKFLQDVKYTNKKHTWQLNLANDRCEAATIAKSDFRKVHIYGLRELSLTLIFFFLLLVDIAFYVAKK